MEFHDPLESCPYNIRHRVRRSRMQFHVTTCAQNYRGPELIQCPFDARHLVKQIEFEHHKRTCPARASVIDYAIHDAPSQAKLKILPIDVKPVGRWEEKWDNDPDVKTYNPIKYIQNKPIVHALIGVSKAKRIKHRLQERIRYQQVIQNEGRQFYSRQMNTSLSRRRRIDVIHEIGDDTEEGSKPLRPPINYLAAHLTNGTSVRDSSHTSEPSAYTDPETLSTSSRFDDLSSGTSSSESAPSSNHRMSLRDHWAYDKSSSAIDQTTVNNKDQEACSIGDSDSIVSSRNDYQFSENQDKDQEELSIRDSESVVSSRDDYQFTQDKNHEEFYIHDTASIASSKHNYQLSPYQHQDEGKLYIPDTVTDVVASQNDYHFYKYQNKDQDNFSVAETYSIVSSRDDYQFQQYQGEDQDRLTTADTNSIVSSRDDYQFQQYQGEDQDRLTTADTASIVSSRNDYQFQQYQDEVLSIADSASVVSSKDDYQFQTYQKEDQEKRSIPDVVSITPVGNEFQFHQYYSTDLEKLSIPDVVDITSNNGDFQFRQYHNIDQKEDTVSLASSTDQFDEDECQDHEKLSTTETISTASSKHEYRFSVPQSSKTPVPVSFAFETDSVFTDVEENSVIDISSDTDDEITEIYENNTEILIDDTVNHSPSKNGSQCLMNGYSDVSLLSSETDEALDEDDSLSFKTANNSINSTKSIGEVSIVDKLSKTIEELDMNHKGHKQKNESLNQQINRLKGKLFARCGANFLNLKR